MQYVYGFVWAFPDTLLSVRAGGEFTRNAVPNSFGEPELLQSCYPETALSPKLW